MKDVLYVVLIVRERVITLVRPKKHSIHPSDLHILINTVLSSSSVNSSAAASWLPVCLPKFNPAAFVNAYVTFLRRKDLEGAEIVQTPMQAQSQPSDDVSSSAERRTSRSDGPSVPGQLHEPEAVESEPRPRTPETLPQSNTSSVSVVGSSASPIEIGLICVSGLGEFDAVRSWSSVAAEV